MTESAPRPLTVDVIDIHHELHAALRRILPRLLPEGTRLRTHVTQGDFYSAVRPDDLPDVLVLSYQQSDLPVRDLVAKLKREGFDGMTFLFTGGRPDAETIHAVDATYYKPDGFQALAKAISLALNARR